MRKGFVALLVLSVLFLARTSVLSYHKGKVLGETTLGSQLVFPPVTAGPGYILPDSSFYFLDKLFQELKLTFAFNDQAKVRARIKIAGERLAELRIMLARNNASGVDTALEQLVMETDLATEHLSNAKARGQDVALLARELNETIKIQRDVLGKLVEQSEGTLKFQFKAARTSLKEAKIEVEDELSQEELAKEIEEGLEDQVEEELVETKEATGKLEDSLLKLKEQSSESAKRTLKEREEEVKRSIATNNEEERRVAEKKLAEEKKRQEELAEMREKTSEQIKKATIETQKGAEAFEKLREQDSDERTDEEEEES